MTSIFEGTQPPKTRPKLRSKQGSLFGFQVDGGLFWKSNESPENGSATSTWPGVKREKVTRLDAVGSRVCAIGSMVIGSMGYFTYILINGVYWGDITH